MMSDTTVPFIGTLKAATRRRFTVGQIVWLKSGSPAMTVSDLSTPPSVTVDWFDMEHQACRDAYHEDQLSDHPHLWPSSVMFPIEPPVLVAEAPEPKPPTIRWPKTDD